jgi:hypothetical protein
MVIDGIAGCREELLTGRSLCENEKGSVAGGFSTTPESIPHRIRRKR